MPNLKCHETMFYSQLDETLFFDALKKIPAIRKIDGVGSDLLLTVPSCLPDKALRELLGLFFRYHVDMRQFAHFLTEKNRLWFHDPEKYWFKEVFSNR